MGLRVTLYKNIEKATEEEYDFEAYQSEPSWHSRASTLEVYQLYKGIACKGYGVMYSYSTHSRFREFLVAITVGGILFLDKENKIQWGVYQYATSSPFYKLVYYSDTEGCIDHIVCKELYEQFLRHEYEAVTREGTCDYYKEIYNSWLEMLEEAVKVKGVIVFS